MNLGERLRDTRKEKGLKQRDLARLADVHSVSISRWESGERRIGIEDALKVGPVLGVDPLYLTGEAEDPRPFLGIHFPLGAEQYRKIWEVSAYRKPGQTFEEHVEEVRLHIHQGEPPFGPTSPSASDSDRPPWVEALRESVTQVSRETSAAILHQEERFVGEMVRIGNQMERRDEKQEERDRRQEARDAQNSSLLQGLMSVVQNNNTILQETRDALRESQAESRETREALAKALGTIARLESRLDDTGPPGGEATEEERQTQWQTRGIRLQGRTQSEGGASA